MARAVRLHPAVIAVGVVAVGGVFGLLGLIIAVPILSLVTILIDDFWMARSEDELIVATDITNSSDRAPSTPAACDPKPRSD